MSEKIVTLKHKGKNVEVESSKFHEFASYLIDQERFSSVEADAHISMVYGGNLFAVAEFMNWYTWDKESKKMKALPISIYKNPDYAKCSNGGITERFDEILILCDEGFIDVTGEEENLCVIEKLRGYSFVRPFKDAPRDCIGWMFGGSYAGSSDARFHRMSGISYALSIHDRCETQKQYEMLSR